MNSQPLPNPVMHDPIRQIFDELEANRARFLATLTQLDDAQLSFRPRPSSWSALEVAEHVMIADQMGIDSILRLAGRASKRRSPLQRLGYLSVWLILRLRLRVKAPSRLLTPSGGLTLRQIRVEWDASRARLRECLEELDAGALQQAGFGHPIAGPLNLREGLLFLQRHMRHHQEQLERLKRHARFPHARAAALSAG